ETSRGAFLIRTGEVEAQVALPGGGMLTVAELGEGDMFGEMALIERGVCSASVVARSAVEGWFVARDDFRAFVASRDPAALELPRGAWLFAAGSPANACFLVVRGAVEVLAKFQDLERRVALAGPGELVGYLAVLEGAPHVAAARVREPAWLLELPAREFLA